EKSGALITADFALEQGRDVGVVPGSIFSPNSAGANNLLKQGATPVTSVEDILNLIGSPPGDCPELAWHVPDLSPEETSVYSALGTDPRHIDELVHEMGLGPGAVSAALAMLELKGIARQVGSMLYTRA